MTAKRLPNKHRPTSYRVFQSGELSQLMNELRMFSRRVGRQWRLLVRLAIEAAASPKDMANATWEQFDQGFYTWRIPSVRHGCKTLERPVVMTRTGRHILRLLARMANPADPRVFHHLPASPSILSQQFGFAARRAGLDDFCMRDLATVGLAKRVRAAAGLADITEVLWSLGWRHGKAPRMARPFLPS